jgi:hypothetical protein
MMQEVGIRVRPANLADVPSLVELRLANAEAHVALDPGVYRLPQRAAVVGHFTAVLADEAGRMVFWSPRIMMAGWSG